MITNMVIIIIVNDRLLTNNVSLGINIYGPD